MAALSNKVAIVTGASSGIGRAAAKLFALDGAKPVSYTHLTLPTNREV